MEAPKSQLPILLICLLTFSDIFVGNTLSEGVTPQEARELRDEVLLHRFHCLTLSQIKLFLQFQFTPINFSLGFRRIYIEIILRYFWQQKPKFSSLLFMFNL